jgi:hypothetical protein
LGGELSGYSLDIENSNRWEMLLLEQYAFRFSERLVNEMTSDTIEQDCLVDIASDDAKKAGW